MSLEVPSGLREKLEVFIEGYHNEPSLWQTKSKEYFDRNKKNAAYDKLVEIYKSIDPNANRKIVVKKINNLRSTYKKELHKVHQSQKSRAGSDEVHSPTLWFYQLFDFLQEQETPRKSTSNISDDENEVRKYFRV